MPSLKHFTYALLLICGPVAANPYLMGGDPGLSSNDARMAIRVNNRVLACPNDQPITVLDLVRKLDILFLQQFPQLADSSQARFQFYQTMWRNMLDELINQELILADAEEKEVAVEDGEIHQQMEQMFGPDVVNTIDELGLNHETAWEMIKRDLTVGRMQGFMVNVRAFSSVNPSMVAEAYEKFSKQFDGQDEWHYRVLSIRHYDRQEARAAADIAEELLGNAGEIIDLDHVKELLDAKRQAGEIDNRITVSVSKLESRTLGSLAQSHREVVGNLSKGEWSEPMGQVSRVDHCMVYRIFYLVDFVEKKPPPFKEVENQLENQLVNVAWQEEHQKYIGRLRNQYGITDDYLTQMIAADFEPFSLR